MKKVVTFGEIMLRITPQGHYRLGQSESLIGTYGGGEANVAVSLSNFGVETRYVTKLPDHTIGQNAINSLRKYGVDTSCIVRGGHRVGIYYLEKGASQRPSNVIYDRAHSAISEAAPDDFDWNAIFDGYDWFHFTGITPALNDTLASITLEAAKEAKRLGLTVSCDLNYRSKLWSPQKANEVMSELMPWVDVLIANEEDSEKVFGIKSQHSDIEKGTLSHDDYRNVAKQLVSRFNFKYVAITLRESFSADDNMWSAMLYSDDQAYFSNKYKMHIVDRVGGGDSFGAGLIYAMLHGFNKQESIEFATAASCLKHSIEGDFNLVNVQEVTALIHGDGSGRVKR